jgi:hypothetical protein
VALLNGRGIRFLALLAVCPVFAASIDGSASEYEIKSAFLYNFTRFVEWPANPATGNFCIGVVGADPFHGALESAINGRLAAGRGISLRRLKPGEDPGACEIVFVSGTDLNKARAVLASLRSGPVLTVGEAPGFCRSGGIVEFEIKDSKVRLQINLEAAQRAHLQISSKLLSLASIVREGAQ